MSKKSLIDQPTPKKPTENPVTWGAFAAPQVHRARLLGALKTGQMAMSRTKLMEAWTCVTLNHDGESLRVDVGALDANSTESWETEGEAGTIAVQIASLLSAVAGCSGETVSLSVAADVLQVKSAGARYNIPCYPIEAVLTVPLPPTDECMSVDGEALSEAIGRSMPAMSTDGAGRAALCVVNLALDNKDPNLAQVVCCDGRRLHVTSLAIEGSPLPQGWNMSLVASSLSLVRSMAGPVSIREDDKGGLWFVGAERSVSVRTYAENFPNWRQVVPGSCASKITLTDDSLLAAIKRAMLIGVVSVHVDVGGEDDQVVVEGRTDDGREFAETVHADLSGKAKAVKFYLDAKFMAALLASAMHEGEPVTLAFNDEYKPIRAEGCRFTGVIMPMRH